MTRSTKGFTLIEMMLALAFLSFILIFSATVIMQIMRTYNKGLAVKEIQQTSRALLEEITRNARLADVKAGSGFDTKKAASYGRLCLGDTSYIWNKPNDEPFPGDGEAGGVVNKFTNGNNLGVVKVEDKAGVYCSKPTKRIPPGDGIVELVTDRIRIPEFGAKLSRDGRLMNINLVMSTNGEDAPFKDDTRWQCDPGNFFGVFCAVSDFDTTVYLRNGGS